MGGRIRKRSILLRQLTYRNYKIFVNPANKTHQHNSYVISLQMFFLKVHYNIGKVKTDVNVSEALTHYKEAVRYGLNV